MVQKKPSGKNKGNWKPFFNKPVKTTTFKKKKMNKAELGCYIVESSAPSLRTAQMQITKGKRGSVPTS